MPAIDPTARSLLAATEAAQAIQIAYAIQGKALDVAKQKGQAAIQLLESAAQVGKAVDAGSMFDAMG
jgi:hypothetical protein